jgi:hypothetical protein
MSETTKENDYSGEVTIGLVRGIVSICRILAHRDLMSDEVQEALAELNADEDFLKILVKSSEADIRKSKSGALTRKSWNFILDPD